MKKIIYIIIITLFLTTGCEFKEVKKEENLKINTSENVLSSKQLDEIEISNISLVYENNQSNFVFDVKNITDSTIAIEEIKVHLKTSNDEVVLTGYIGGTIEPGDVVTLTSSYRKDLTKAISVEYEIVK